MIAAALISPDSGLWADLIGLFVVLVVLVVLVLLVRFTPAGRREWAMWTDTLSDATAADYDDRHIGWMTRGQSDAFQAILDRPNPLPTMVGDEVAAALRAGKCVEYLSGGSIWVEAGNPDYWNAHNFAMTVVARIVEPPVEPVPAASETDECGLEGPGGYLCCLPEDHDGEHTAWAVDEDDVCERWPAASDPLPEGVERISDGRLLAHSDTLAARPMGLRGWQRFVQGEWHGDDHRGVGSNRWYEVRPTPPPEPRTATMTAREAAKALLDEDHGIVAIDGYSFSHWVIDDRRLSFHNYNSPADDLYLALDAEVAVTYSDETAK